MVIMEVSGELEMRLPMTVIALLSLAWAFAPPGAAARPAAAAAVHEAAPADFFQYPLPAWQEHCLSFGSPWRLCNGTVLRRCTGSGAIWLHTGFDAVTGIAPVMAAANGVIAGYTVDPTFKGGILIRHVTAEGVILTQYWHVWPRPGFHVGTVVTRGEVFADVANMGSLTHLHFAVYRGDFTTATAWRGALPPAACDGFPAFPNRFVEPNAFVQSHMAPAPSPTPHRCHLP